MQKDYSIFINNLRILLKYKKFILLTTLIIVLLTAFTVFFIIKPVFFSSATVKASAKIGGLSTLLGGGGLADIGGLDELSGGGSVAKELALYSQIVYSRRCLEEAVLKFNLMEDYNQKYMEKMLTLFREDILDVEKDVKSGTLVIGIYDYYPERSKEITEFIVERLNKINTELNVLNAKNNREFIENRYNLIRKDLAQAEDSLKNYQELFGLAPDITAKAVLQTEVQIEAELSSEEIKLEMLRKVLSPDQSEIKIQEEKIAALKKQLQEIKQSNDTDRLLRLKGSPEKIVNFYRLQRNVEIQNKLLTFILPLFEQAKIEEKKEMPTVLVLDKPYVPELKKKPKRIIIIGLSLLISLGLLSTSILVYENYLKDLLLSLKKRDD